MSRCEVSESPVDELPLCRNFIGGLEQYGCYITKIERVYQKRDRLPEDYTYRPLLEFRTRRNYRFCSGCAKALRLKFGTSDEIGVFIKLTNSYVLIGGEQHSENLYTTIKGDLWRMPMPVINTSLAGCRIIGRMCVGNKHGLILPDTTYDTELQQLKKDLPDSVKISKVEEKLSALGNVIACNDHVALVHPDLDRETEEIIGDTLQVEIFRHMIADNPLVGSYCVLSNHGGLVSVDTNNKDLENLASLLQLPVVAGTINRGNKIVSSGLLVNDYIAYAGMKTTPNEFLTIGAAFESVCKGHDPYNPKRYV